MIAIRALITNGEACIEELHLHFPARDRVSAASQGKESQLLKIIEAHRAVLSPVRYLPSEILQEIFLRYADNLRPNVAIATMPWHLGHISHRWRKIALSLPSLWDNIPKFDIFEKPKRPYVRALICLIQRSGTSPTLKFDISGYPSLNLKKVSKSSIFKEIMLHSERIEQLRIEVNEATMQLFQGFKGRLPNLRILRVFLNAIEAPSLDIFENAPALRKVAIGGIVPSSVKVFLPWSQITHFEEQLFHSDCIKVDRFLESLTIPAIEVMKIYCVEPHIPRLVSMLSGSPGPSRLQKLAFRTIPLQTGELSALLNLTPHLVELDIDVPPADDLLRLIYAEGGVMLVPKLQALHLRSSRLTLDTHQTEHLNTLAQARCELGSRKDSEDATLPSLGSGTWATLDTLRFVLDSEASRDSMQKKLNNWSSSFTPEEAMAKEMIIGWSYPNSKSFMLEDKAMLNLILARVEHYEVTNKVLHVGIFFWMLACGIFTLIFFLSSGDKFIH